MALIYGPPASDERQQPVEPDAAFVLPASQGQERLWFLDMLEPNSAVYNMSTALCLHGNLDSGVLERVLLELAARHETLRTSFAVENDQPVQVIAAKPRILLERMCLQDLTPEDRATEAARLGVEAARQPFDLGRGPLFRTTLIKLDEKKHVLFLVLHHSICDGWSFGVLSREFAALYDAFMAGRPSPLPDLPIQFADYAHWQHEWLAGETVQRRLAYWQHHLEGAPSLLSLPTDYPRPLTQRFKGTNLPLSLPPEDVTALRAFSLREGVTLFMTLLAGWQGLLARYSGQEDIVVGVPYANRSQVETEGLIGFFVNTLALRTDLSGDPSFVELVHRVRDTALGAYANQDVSFEKVVEVLQPERTLAFSPIFQTQLAFQNTAPVSMRLPGLVVEAREIDNGTAQFDLSLVLDEIDGALTGKLEYNTDLFEMDTISRMIGHLQVFLAGAAATPEKSISSLPLLTNAERRKVLVEWNETAAPYPADRCLHQLFEDQVARTPDVCAVKFENTQLSYAQLNARANQLAHHLRGLGVGPETLVALCVERSPELMIGLLGILKAGGAYVPLDPSYPRERLAFMLLDCQASVLLTQKLLLGQLPARAAAHVVCLDMDWPTIERETTANPESGVTPKNLAYVIYTSGSTGRPKGAMNEHGGIVNRLWWMQDAYRLQPGETVLQKTPAGFDVSVWEFFWPLLVGARLVLARPEGHKDPMYLAGLIARDEVTTIHFVPSMLRVFLGELDLSGCAGLRRIVCSGEALSADLAAACLERLPGASLYNLYGPTEAAVDVSHWTCTPDNVTEGVPIGRPVANTALYVLDTAMQPVPIGVPGELYLGGVQVGRGYWRRPELTAERFVPDTFGQAPDGRLYRTGDRARRRADGAIEYLGRLDSQIKLRGFRIELSEIEATLRHESSVAEAVVVLREDRPNEKRLVAYVVPVGSNLTPDTLRTALRGTLPDYMVPSVFVVVDALPLSPNGKVDRQALSAPKSTGRPTAEYVKPTVTLHHQLIQIWEELLDIRPIGITDSFFELGGHSLLAARMVDRIERACGKRIPLATLFTEPTIEHLTRVLLRQEGDAPEPRIVALNSGGARHPFFFLHGDQEGGGFYTIALARKLGAEQPFYVLTPYGVGGNVRIPRTIEAMAKAQLKEIRTIQKHGPYILGGFCADGVIAFEMAQQLRACGERVDLLVLLDTDPAPRKRRIRQVIEGVGQLAGLAADAQLDVYLRLCAYDARRKEFGALNRGEQLRLTLHHRRNMREWIRSNVVEAVELRKVRSGNHLVPVHGPRDLEGIYRWITAAYRPRSYSGRIVHFWAEEGHAVYKDSVRKVWQAIAPNSEFHVMPGAHLTFITTYGDRLAATIAACVAAAQGE